MLSVIHLLYFDTGLAASTPAASNVRRSRGFEGMAVSVSPDGTVYLWPMLEVNEPMSPPLHLFKRARHTLRCCTQQNTNAVVGQTQCASTMINSNLCTNSSSLATVRLPVLMLFMLGVFHRDLSSSVAILLSQQHALRAVMRCASTSSM